MFNKCNLCKDSEESIDHNLIHYYVTLVVAGRSAPRDLGPHGES